jgi:hypothetical protein
MVDHQGHQATHTQEHSSMNETFTFATLAELRDWLNRFKTTDLDIVYPADGDNITLIWIERELSDGSLVNDVTISTNEDTPK